jgi:hypothetical protein
MNVFLLVPWQSFQQLKQENFNLKKSIGEIPKINSKLDDLEQHSRKSCVRISGVPESEIFLF